jgi:hypothetical protein
MVAAHITGAPADEKEEILRNVESHIYEALNERAGEHPTAADAEAVLAEMDPPESYADTDGSSAAPLYSAEKSPVKISRAAMLGGLWILYGIFFILFEGGGGYDSFWQNMILYIFLFLAFLSPFTGTALGWIGISHIKRSEGKVTGMPLAFAAAVFYPVLAFDGIVLLLVMLLFRFLGAYLKWVPFTVIVGCIILAADIFIIRAAWKAVVPRMRTSGSYVEASTTKMCRTAVIGALWIPFGLLLAFTLYVCIRKENTGINPMLFLVPQIPGTVLGSIAISKIRRSAGTLTGLEVAVTAALFLPLSIFAVLIYGLCGGNLISLPIILIVSYLLVRICWKQVSRAKGQA